MPVDLESSNLVVHLESVKTLLKMPMLHPHEKVLKYTLHWLTKCTRDAIENHSTAGSSEYMKAVHSQCQLLASLLTHSCEKVPPQLLELTLKITGMSIFGLETRTLAGLVVCLILNACPVKDWFPVFYDLSTSSIDSVESIESMETRPFIKTKGNESLEEVFKQSMTRSSLPFLLNGMNAMNPETLFEKTPKGDSILLFHFETLYGLVRSSNDTPSLIATLRGISKWLEYAHSFLIKKRVSHRQYCLELEAWIDQDFVDRIVSLVYDKWDDILSVLVARLSDILNALINLLSNYPARMDCVVQGLLKKDKTSKAKYDILALILRKFPSTVEIVSQHPFVFSEAFEVVNNLTFGKCAINFLSMLLPRMSLDGFSKWGDLFLDTLTQESNTNDTMLQKLVPHVLSNTELAKLLYLRMNERSDMTSSGRLIVSLCLVKVLGNEQLGEGILNAVGHSDPRVRLQILGSLTTSTRTDVTDSEMDMVKEFLIVNARMNDVADRQKIVSFLNGFLERLKRMLYMNVRDRLSLLKSLEVRPVKVHANILADINGLERLIELKESFWKWLQSLVVGFLLPGSSFPRASIGISILECMVQIQKLKIDGFAIDSWTGKFTIDFNDEFVGGLVSAMTQTTYEPHRVVLLDCLKGCHSLGDSSISTYWMSKASSLLKSIKSSDSEKAAMLIRFTFNIFVMRERLVLPLDPQSKVREPLDPVPFFIREFEELLKDAVNLATLNLRQATETKPMNGILECLCVIVRDLNVNELSELAQSQLRLVLDQVVKVTFSACSTVMEICCDASPEGYVPASFADMHIHSDDSAEHSVQDTTNLAQLILRQCFRTVKGASSLLEAIVTLSLDSVELISMETVTEIGDLFCQMLTSIRHRGAFSAVYASFTTLCQSLIDTGSSESRQLPFAWLEKFMDQMQKMQVSVTRRSAGLPLAILSVLTVIGKSHEQVFQSTIRKLIAISSGEFVGRDETVDDVRVHSLNILKALMHDAGLSPLTRDSVGECFITTIHLFSSPSYPIRNCASMLFATLVNKSLGSKKSKREDDVLNMVSPREFFGKLPELFPVILSEFEKVVGDLERELVHPLLYPILTLLSRMKPMKSRDESRPFEMGPFANLALKCTKSVHLKVRDMAARATACLVPECDVLVLLKSVIEQTKGSLNVCHGSLVTFKSLLVIHLPNYVESNQMDVIDQIIALLEGATWLRQVGHSILHVYLQIVDLLRETTGRALSSLVSFLDGSSWPTRSQHGGVFYGLNVVAVTKAVVSNYTLDSVLKTCDPASIALAFNHLQTLKLSHGESNDLLNTLFEFLFLDSRVKSASDPRDDPDCVLSAIQLLLILKPDLTALEPRWELIESNCESLTQLPAPFKRVGAIMMLLSHLTSLLILSQSIHLHPTILNLLKRRWHDYIADPMVSIELRRYVIQSLTILINNVSLDQFALHEAELVDVLFVLEAALNDDNDQIREDAAVLTCRWIGIDIPLGSPMAHRKLTLWIVSRQWSLPSRQLIWDTLTSRLEVDFVSVCKRLMDEISMQSSVLFEAEALNAYRENLADTLTIHRVLSTFPGMDSSKLQSFVDEGVMVLENFKDYAQQSELSKGNVVWIWNHPDFLHGLGCLVLSQKLLGLPCFSHDPVIDSILIKCHPFVKLVFERDFESMDRLLY